MDCGPSWSWTVMPFEVTYRIGGAGCGPVAVTLNGVALDFERAASPYRTGRRRSPG